MSRSKIKKSWDRDSENVYSPLGLETLRNNVKRGLRRKYYGIGQSMFRYEGFDDDHFSLMRKMSRDTVPEKLLMRYGWCVWFRDEASDSILCMPAVQKGGVNIYGEMTHWSPVPWGYTEGKQYNDPKVVELMSRDLTDADSVMMWDSLFDEGEKDYIDSMINELVEVQLTENQLVLLARAPFVFNVSEDNLLTAKNFFLSMARCEPVIYRNKDGEDASPVVTPTPSKLDPTLFEIFDRFECSLLEYLGIECVPITKRAQQSVSEVQSNGDKIYLRRQEKLNARKNACDRINAMFGTTLSVVSVIDERKRLQQNVMMQNVGNEVNQ